MRLLERLRNIGPLRPSQIVVWVVGFAAGFQSLLQAGDAALQGSLPRFGLWIGGAFAIAPLTAWAEKLKAVGGES